jgi:integrase
LARLLPVFAETPHGRALRFMLWTAARREEVVAAIWGEFDLDAGLWSLPASRRKGGKVAHVVPLPKQAVAYLRSLKIGSGDDLIFIGNRDAQLQNWARATTAINAPLGFPTWSAHSMRRTCATLAGESGVKPHVLSAMLGHAAIGSQLLSGYNKARYAAEVGEALQIVADQLDAIAAGVDNVIPMRRPN